LQSGIDLPYHAIKSNIADSLNVIVQLERRPGKRLVTEVLDLKGYDPEADRFDFTPLYLREEEICPH
jgi:Flp pilus assembly CpaF family ATPase